MYIIKAPIKHRKKIAEKIFQITFDISGKEFLFQAGQYIRVTIPKLTNLDPRGNYRDFSISSSPNNKNELTITTRASESGFKRFLLESHKDVVVNITGPYGDFVLPKETNTDLIFIAGGIGITPILSMLRDITENKLPYKVSLLYSSKSQKDTPYVAELEALSKKNPNFTYSLVFERITEEHIKALSYTAATHWYISGPPVMVENTTKLVKLCKVSPKHISVEDFLGYDPGKTFVNKAISRRITIESLIGREISMLDQIRNAILLESLNKTAIASETDAEGTIVYVNDRFVEVSKYNREELIGQNHRILKSSYHTDKFYRNLWRTISSGRIWRGEILNKAKDGSYYWVDTIINPILGKDNLPIKYVSVRFLITERKKVEEELKEANKKLVEIDKAKSEFISFASHQMRTPISAISWYTERILDAKQKDNQVKVEKYLTDLYTTTQKTMNLVNDLLNISRIELGTYVFHYQAVNLRAITAESINEITQQIQEKELRFVEEYDNNMNSFTADPYSLRIILSNLLSNAVKYTPPGGSVNLKALQKNNHLFLEVCDTGYGIPSSAHSKIFDKMYRANNVKVKTDGTGLGLYMVKTVLDHVGGTIHWESKLNKGTTFSVSIPLS